MEFKIGDRYKDTKEVDREIVNRLKAVKETVIANSDICVIVNVTSNSVELSHIARTSLGVNCNQWYSVQEGNSLKDFVKRFIKIQ